MRTRDHTTIHAAGKINSRSEKNKNTEGAETGQAATPKKNAEK